MTFVWLFPMKVQAAQSTVNYSVTPQLTEDQVDKSVGYYDLKMRPNQKKMIKFKINNNSDQTQSYKIEINRATTDVNGVIVYNVHGVYNPYAKYNIEDLVTYPKEISVPAKSSKEVSVNIAMPNGNFDGELLGGILVEENNQVSNKAYKGISIKNKYNYVLGLQLQQNTDVIKPNLKLIRAYQKVTNTNQISVYGEIVNDVARVEKNVNVIAKVTPKNSSKTVLSSTNQKMSIAPDSRFDYPIKVNSLTGVNKNKRLKPGQYTMYLNIKANNGNQWKLHRNFTVTAQQNKKINRKVPNNGNSIWIIISAIVAMLVIAGSVIYIYRKRR